jgi:hypothetical protein
VQAEDLKFRQTPTFADCFPGSTKEYKTVDFNGESIKVNTEMSLVSGSLWLSDLSE